MKTVFLLMIFLLMTICGFSQDSIQKQIKYEINLGYFNILQLTNSNNFGIGLKRHSPKFGLRTNLVFNFNKENDYGIEFEEINKKIRTDIKLGFEVHKLDKEYFLYYGVDLITKFEKVTGKIKNDFFEELMPNYESEYKAMGIGLSPFIGIKYFIKKRISISSEIKLDFIYQQEKIFEIETYYPNISEVRYINKETRSYEVQLTPLGLVTLNFHF